MPRRNRARSEHLLCQHRAHQALIGGRVRERRGAGRLRLAEAARGAEVPVFLVSDAGRTQLPSGTLTCCAIGPADERRIDALTGDLPLL